MLLESTVSQIVSSLHGHAGQHSPTVTENSRPDHRATNTSISVMPAPDVHLSPPVASVGSRIKLLSSADLELLGSLYLKYRSCQPLFLFPPEPFASSLHRRDDAMLSAILLVTLRYASRIGSFSHQQDVLTLRESATTSVMGNVIRGDVGLSTLQILCLIVLHDLEGKSNDYRTQQPRVDTFLQMETAPKHCRFYL